MAAASGLTAEEAAFLFFPNRYAHVSWRAELMPAAVWDMLASSPRVEGRFAAFVIEKTGLGDAPVKTLASPQARFCQLPGAAAVQVARKVGLALNGARLTYGSSAPRIIVPLEQNQPPVPLTQAIRASGTWRGPHSPRS